MNVNRVELIGNLTRDPELRYVGASNTPLVTATLAVNDKPYKNAKGEDVNKTHFIDLKCFGKSGEEVAANFKKGSRVEVRGALEQETWETKEGDKRSKLIVKCFEVKAPEKKNSIENAPAVAAGTGAGGGNDIPF